MKKSILFLLSGIVCMIIFASSSCQKDKPLPPPEEQLPPITQEGKGTFGCKVNGKVWIPKVTKGGGIFGSTYEPIACSFYKPDSNRVSIGTHIYTDLLDEVIEIYFLPLNSAPQSFNLTEIKSKNSCAAFTDNSNDSYKTDSINNGGVSIIKFDTIQKIISGTFQFNGKNSKGNIANITEGRFDLKYK